MKYRLNIIITITEWKLIPIKSEKPEIFIEGGKAKIYEFFFLCFKILFVKITK